MNETLQILSSLVLGFSVLTSSAHADEKVRLSPGMLLRIWGNVSTNAQSPGNEPSGAGVIDLGGDFYFGRVRELDQFQAPIGSGQYHALEWSGYVRIDKENTYHITINAFSCAENTSVYLYLKGNKVLNLTNFRNASKTATVKLSPGYYPISLFTVQRSVYKDAMRCQIKIRPQDELDSEPMKVSDFYFRKK